MAVLASFGGAVQAQDVYGGLGVPGMLTLGYASPMAVNWGWRGEFAGGLNVSKDGNQDGVNATGFVKANRAGAFADWFPFNGGFRLVGGLTANSIKAEFNAVGSGTATIDGKLVDMTGETFNVSLKYPSVTPYLGIGWGHRASNFKGLGFYADLGVMISKFNTSVSTSLVGNPVIGGGTITLADVDAQTQIMRDSVGKLSVLPSVSVGLTYRF